LLYFALNAQPPQCTFFPHSEQPNFELHTINGTTQQNAVELGSLVGE